jgi:hypothetical protein
VAERDLAAAARRHAPEGLPRPPAELVDRLTDHFLRLVPPTSVTWVHPSWRDLVVEQLAADAGARRRFLERCGIDGALLALSRAGGATGERVRPLLVEDGDWDALTDRLHLLIPTLGDPELVRLFATLEDGLTSGSGELAALAYDALSALRRTWARGRSLPTADLLRRWRLVAALLDEAPPEPHPAQVWDPAPTIAPDVPVVRHGTPVPQVDWGERERAAALVARILADLDAA